MIIITSIALGYNDPALQGATEGVIVQEGEFTHQAAEYAGVE